MQVVSSASVLPTPYRLPVLSSVVKRSVFIFFFQAEDGIRDFHVTGVQTCALPISRAVLSLAPSEQATKARERKAAKLRKKHGPKYNQELVWWAGWVILVTTTNPAEWSGKELVALDRKSTRLNSSHVKSRMPSSA